MLEECKGGFGIKLLHELQWWIQDLHWVPTRREGNILFGQNLPKLHKHEENYYVDPPQNCNAEDREREVVEDVANRSKDASNASTNKMSRDNLNSTA